MNNIEEEQRSFDQCMAAVNPKNIWGGGGGGRGRAEGFLKISGRGMCSTSEHPAVLFNLFFSTQLAD